MMYLKSLVAFSVFFSLSLPSFADTFQKEMVVAPKVKETVVVHTDEPVSFDARFVNADPLEAQRCGNCLHIETVVQGSRNQAASSFGVGFMFVPPENGIVSVEVFHDYDSARTIEVKAKPYKAK